MNGNKEFKAGKKVLVLKLRMKIFPRKLNTRWYEPFIVRKAFPYSAVELFKEYETSFKVNGNQIKHYEGVIDKKNEELEVTLETVVTK